MPNYYDYLSEYLRSNSMSKLARETGYSAKTIKRLLSKETKVEELKEGDKALRLIEVIMGLGSVHEAYVNSPKSIQKKVSFRTLGRTADFESTNSAPRSGGDKLESYLSDNPIRILVFLIACTEGGATIDEIRRNAGYIGEKEINNLVEHGFAKLAGNAYVSTLPGNRVLWSRKFIRDNANYLSQNYKIENSGKNFNYISLTTGRLNLKTIQKLQSLTEKYHQEVATIFMDKKAIGDIPYFINLTQDSIGQIYCD